MSDDGKQNTRATENEVDDLAEAMIGEADAPICIMEPAIRVSMMPKDTNGHGTIFGGIILSYIDQAGAIGAHQHMIGRLVTVSMREVEFHQPVFVGDLVSFYTELVRLGKTSITVRVTVMADRAEDGVRVKVTEAEVVYVHIDRTGRPAQLKRRARPEPQPKAGP